MSELHEAEILARWLNGMPGTPVPKEIDEDVAEAVYALKPNLAPAPQVSIDQILDGLTSGPLVDPVIANALKNWLKSGPGTPPPKMLPIGVVEATYALRPEMAPAPRFSIEDVLEGVSEGPLATRSSPNKSNRSSLRVSSANTSPTATRAPFTWGRGSTFGALAVAALALFIVVPSSSEIMKDSSPFEGPNAVADAPQLHSVAFEPQEKPLSTQKKAATTKTDLSSTGSKTLNSNEKTGSPSGQLQPKKQTDDSLTPPILKAKETITTQAPPTLEKNPARDEQPNWGLMTEAKVKAEVPSVLPEATHHKQHEEAEIGDWAHDDDGQIEAEYAATPPPSARASASAKSRPRPRSRGLRRSNRGDVALDAVEPSSSTINIYVSEILDLHQSGNAEAALEKLDYVLPLFNNDIPAQLKLLRMKVKILRTLERETDAQQAESEIKRLLQGG